MGKEVPPRTRPAPDPKAFVAEAERITNERDLDTIWEVFAPHGQSTSIIDGIISRDEGVGSVAARWRLQCQFMADRGWHVKKELLAFSADTIVNSWQGTTRGGQTPMGLESWTFNGDGQVTDQFLVGSLAPRPETSPAALIGLLVAQPVNALTFARHRLSSRGGATPEEPGDG